MRELHSDKRSTVKPSNYHWPFSSQHFGAKPPFPRSIWTHPNAPIDSYDTVCKNIWSDAKRAKEQPQRAQSSLYRSPSQRHHEAQEARFVRILMENLKLKKGQADKRKNVEKQTEYKQMGAEKSLNRVWAWQLDGRKERSCAPAPQTVMKDRVCFAVGDHTPRPPLPSKPVRDTRKSEYEEVGVSSRDISGNTFASDTTGDNIHAITPTPNSQEFPSLTKKDFSPLSNMDAGGQPYHTVISNFRKTHDQWVVPPEQDAYDHLALQPCEELPALGAPHQGHPSTRESKSKMGLGKEETKKHCKVSSVGRTDQKSVSDLQTIGSGKRGSSSISREEEKVNNPPSAHGTPTEFSALKTTHGQHELHHSSSTSVSTVPVKNLVQINKTALWPNVETQQAAYNLLADLPALKPCKDPSSPGAPQQGNPTIKDAESKRGLTNKQNHCHEGGAFQGRGSKKKLCKFSVCTRDQKSALDLQTFGLGNHRNSPVVSCEDAKARNQPSARGDFYQTAT